MATRITVHASPLLLQRGVRGVTGQPMEIVVHLPTSPAFSARGFEFDSAFPTPDLLTCLPELGRRASERPDARLLLFGHADEAGGDEYNKRLADRRAKLVFALLTQNLNQLDEVAQEDAWSLIQYQAMLVALGVVPMVVDGKPGPKTNTGVTAFQRGYNAAQYHERALRERAHGTLKVDGELGVRSEAAVRDAYLALIQVKLDPARFFGPKIAGCGEFNRAGEPANDRRVVLALYRPDFPTEGKIPCKEGDAASCKVNRKAQHPWKCNFYRRTLEGETLVSPKQQSAAIARTEGHVSVHLYSPKGKPVCGARARLTASASAGGNQELVSKADAPLAWSGLGLDEYVLELELGAAKLSVPVPWLHADDPAHHQCVRELASLLDAAGAVHAAQVRLLGLKYHLDAASSELDAPTRSALRRFQQEHGLPADGALGEATSRALKTHFGA